MLPTQQKVLIEANVSRNVKYAIWEPRVATYSTWQGFKALGDMDTLWGDTGKIPTLNSVAKTKESSMLWWYFGAVISGKSRSPNILRYTTKRPRNCKLFKCVAETFNWNPFLGPEQMNKQTESHLQERVSTSMLKILRILIKDIHERFQKRNQAK